MKYTLIIALVVVLATPALSQNDSGIFLTIECGKKVPRETVTLTLKQVCLATNPIINTSDFESVTEVHQENQKVSFDLGLSRKAADRLRGLVRHLPSAEFALVVEKEVFVVFPANNLNVKSAFRFEGGSKDLPTFLRIQEKLKSLTAKDDGGTE